MTYTHLSACMLYKNVLKGQQYSSCLTEWVIYTEVDSNKTTAQTQVKMGSIKKPTVIKKNY